MILGLPFFKKVYQFTNTDISVAAEKSLPALPGQAYACPIKDPLKMSLEEISQALEDLSKSTEENHAGLRTFMRIIRRLPPPLGAYLLEIVYLHTKLWAEYRGSAAWVNIPSRISADLVSTTWPWPLNFSVGVVKKRPFVVGNEVRAIQTMPAVMIFDRRIMGGRIADQVFQSFLEILESADPGLFKTDHD